MGPEWDILGCSVRGASHERSGQPNQDAIDWAQRESAIVLALSDGHGSAKSFRSDVGAKLAVRSALATIDELFPKSVKAESASAVKRLAESSLGQAMLRKWRGFVDVELALHPLDAPSLVAFEEREGSAARAAIEANPYLVYGATLITCLLTDYFVLFFQLGDGDILIVDDDAQVQRPMPPDSRLFANETTSLCAREAWRDARVVMQMLTGNAPEMILVSTDGYPNSFRTDEDFASVGRDLLSMLRTEGPEAIGGLLPAWLADATAAGSGDDVTVGILCRRRAREQGAPAPQPPAVAIESGAVAAGSEAMRSEALSSGPIRSEAISDVQRPAAPLEHVARPASGGLLSRAWARLWGRRKKH